jgi:hypothetical protein
MFANYEERGRRFKELALEAHAAPAPPSEVNHGA